MLADMIYSSSLALCQMLDTRRTSYIVATLWIIWQLIKLLKMYSKRPVCMSPSLYTALVRDPKSYSQANVSKPITAQYLYWGYIYFIVRKVVHQSRVCGRWGRYGLQSLSESTQLHFYLSALDIH